MLNFDEYFSGLYKSKTMCWFRGMFNGDQLTLMPDFSRSGMPRPRLK